MIGRAESQTAIYNPNVMSDSSLKNSLDRQRPWWLAPIPIAFGVVIVLASAAVFLQDTFFPPKPVDPRTNIVLPGNGAFCDVAPRQEGVPIDSTSVPQSPAK
jgi:hypothetical protein